MNIRVMRSLVKAIQSSIAFGLLSLATFPAWSAEDDPTPINRSDAVDEVVEDRAVPNARRPGTEQEARSEQAQADPVQDVQESAKVLQEMQSDPDMRRVLDEAEGVFIIPDYVTAALIIGGSGGEGVLFTRDNSEWRNPAFYDIGELDIGVQAGVSAGSIAMVLNNAEALNSFESDNNFALNAAAGYSVLNWSERAQAQAGLEGDLIVWTDTEGLLGELSIGVSGISFDEEENQAYYGQQASAQEILNGSVQDPQEQMLQQALREQ